MQTEVSVRYFGNIAEKAGVDREIVGIEEGLTTDQFRELITSKHELGEYNFQMAVNQRLADKGARLKAGDEIAFLPPFAGG